MRPPPSSSWGAELGHWHQQPRLILRQPVAGCLQAACKGGGWGPSVWSSLSSQRDRGNCDLFRQQEAQFFEDSELLPQPDARRPPSLAISSRCREPIPAVPCGFFGSLKLVAASAVCGKILISSEPQTTSTSLLTPSFRGSLSRHSMTQLIPGSLGDNLSCVLHPPQTPIPHLPAERARRRFARPSLKSSSSQRTASRPFSARVTIWQSRRPKCTEPRGITCGHSASRKAWISFAEGWILTDAEHSPSWQQMDQSTGAKQTEPFSFYPLAYKMGLCED